MENTKEKDKALQEKIALIYLEGQVSDTRRSKEDYEGLTKGSLILTAVAGLVLILSAILKWWVLLPAIPVTAVAFVVYLYARKKTQSQAAKLESLKAQLLSKQMEEAQVKAED